MLSVRNDRIGVDCASCNKSKCIVAGNVDRGLIYLPVYVLQMLCVILLSFLVQTKAR